MIICFICMAFLASSLLASRRCHDAFRTEYDSLENFLFFKKKYIYHLIKL
jgi:hypothetical protein